MAFWGLHGHVRASWMVWVLSAPWMFSLSALRPALAPWQLVFVLALLGLLLDSWQQRQRLSLVRLE